MADQILQAGDDIKGAGVAGDLHPLPLKDIPGLGLVQPVVGVNPVTGAVVNQAQPAVLGNGRKEVAVAGVAEPLVAVSTPIRKIDIRAELDNTGVIVVGSNTVVAAAATRSGMPLDAGDVLTLEIDDAQKIYLDTTVPGDGVTYLYST